MNYEKILPLILKQEVTRNPKGYFSRLRLSHKRILLWIDKHTLKIKNTASIGEKVYWIINHLDDYPICEECHKNPAKFYGVIKGYGKFCSLKCTNKNSDRRQRAIKT